MRVVDLPSGAKLEITMAPFAQAKVLYMALMEECKSLKIDASTELDVNFWKDLMCIGLSSKKIDAAIEECMRRCLYNGLKIDKDSFESEDARQDYLVAVFEVASENVKPFTKSLFAKYAGIFQSLKKPPA